MESAGPGRRHEKPTHGDVDRHDEADEADENAENDDYDKHDDSGLQPPRFTIDLSLPPAERYNHVAVQMQDRVVSADLEDVFNDLIAAFAPRPFAACLRLLACLSLRRLRCPEETAEIKGISRATGISMHLLVAFNVVLDLLLGCTSGGIRVAPPTCAAAPDPPTHMLHFRTLDWGMDPLRKLVVELDFVRQPGGPVVASSVGYFGYVGMLTGVRRGLSLSLNFRPRHDRSSPRRRAAFRWHQLMALFGFRRSISSVLRQCLLTPDVALDGEVGGREKSAKDARWQKRGAPQKRNSDPVSVSAPVLEYIQHELLSAPSSAAYLIFCTPNTVYSMEKDHLAGSLASSTVFLTTYNHDRSDESHPSRLAAAAQGLPETATGMVDLVAFSLNRKKRMDRNRKRAIKERCEVLNCRPNSAQGQSLSQRDVVRLVLDPEISNEETHYAVVMDPQAGKVAWRRVFEVPPYNEDTH